MATFTLCQIMSEYCHGGKILLNFYYDFGNVIKGGQIGMSEQEKELLQIIHESADPEAVANYMLNLFLDYLRTHGPVQETPAAIPQESA